MSGCNCKWRDAKIDPDTIQRRLHLPEFERTDDPWVMVSEKPGTFGHLVVVTGKCLDCADLSSKKWQKQANLKHLKRTMSLINKLCSHLVNGLRSPDGKVCQRVYVVSQCETQEFHLHFHLYPRFEGEDTGNVFLFEKEFEEARWMKKGEKRDNRVLDGCCRVAKTRGIYEYYRLLISKNSWVKGDDERKEYVKEILTEIKRVITS